MLMYFSGHSDSISSFSLPNKMAEVLVLLSCIEYYSDRVSVWLSTLMTQCLRSLPHFLQDRFCDVTLNGPRPSPSFPIYYSLPSSDTNFTRIFVKLTTRTNKRLFLYFPRLFLHSLLSPWLTISVLFCHVVQVSVSYSVIAFPYDSSVLSVPRARFEPATTLFGWCNYML
jgi:hypothetical protein